MIRLAPLRTGYDDDGKLIFLPETALYDLDGLEPLPSRICPLCRRSLEARLTVHLCTPSTLPLSTAVQ